MPEAPAGFPFEIHDIPGELTIKLTRKFAGEKTVVEVEEPRINSKDKNITENSS